MDFAFEEISVIGGRPIPDEYKGMIDAVSAANDPPHVRSAQTCYLFKIEDGTIVKAWPGNSPVQTLFDFMHAGGWSFAVIPHSILQTGTILSYSVIRKPEKQTCQKNWLGRLRTRLSSH